MGVKITGEIHRETHQLGLQEKRFPVCRRATLPAFRHSSTIYETMVQ